MEVSFYFTHYCLRLTTLTFNRSVIIETRAKPGNPTSYIWRLAKRWRDDLGQILEAHDLAARGQRNTPYSRCQTTPKLAVQPSFS